MSHTPLLDTIHSPRDVQKLSIAQLEKLSVEIRRRIIDVLAHTGGHLASNLGVVEMTLALHKVFDSPHDKFIWDVAHQSYVHKLLTGRNHRFEEIRQYKGLCGFTHPKESPHDHFHAGHAGTALSLGLGVAMNRDLTKRDEYVVPIIGDATLTCGVTLEALNNIHRDLKRFVVILNDNAMSISKNVGAMTRILSRFLSSPMSNRVYQEINNLASKIPSIGTLISKQGQKVTESLKHLVSPALYFEHFNLSYIGPIDGHNLEELVDTLEAVKDSQWPVILHVRTTKGKGMPEAMKNPVSHHGVKPFDPSTRKFLPSSSKKPTFPKVFGQHILEMAMNDPSLVAVTPAMSYGSQLDAFMKKFPERCIDTGIAESHAVTFAGGLAYGSKMKVVMSIYSTFLQRALDNTFLDICLQELPVVLAIDRAGIAGGDGATHNGLYDIAFLKAMPNMVIAQPRNGQLLKELMESAFDWKSPAAIRYPNLSTEEGTAPLRKRELGCGEVLVEGKEILLVGLGHMCDTALDVRERLKEYGIHATVLDPIFVKPLDSDLLCRLLLDHHTLVTMEEHSLISGLGNSINHFLMTHDYHDTKVLNFGVPETFVEHGSHKELMEELNLTPEKITQSIVSQLHLKKAVLDPVAP